MPQTKRKRRTKHRGTAAGTIEARGRTGRKPRPDEMPASGKGARARPPRGTAPPTWKAAFAKAAFGALMLFVFVKLGVLGGEKASTSSALTLSVIAAVLYTPIMFTTDKFLYQRRLRALQPPAKKP